MLHRGKKEEETGMKITMITGSAHKTGTSAYLSENFVVDAQ